MIDEMNNRIAEILMRGQIPEMQQQVQEAAPEQHSRRYIEQKNDLGDETGRSGRAAQQAAMRQDTRNEGAPMRNHTPYKAEKMPRPNDPCPCGSGKKFKYCHGKNLF
jgi:preprotein translocase subunit SecA